MNWDQIEGRWKQMKGEVKRRWGKLTDSDFTVIGGNKDKLIGTLQERYGYEKERAEKELSDFVSEVAEEQRASKRVHQ